MTAATQQSQRRRFKQTAKTMYLPQKHISFFATQSQSQTPRQSQATQCYDRRGEEY
jgi:hypothetical protein